MKRVVLAVIETLSGDPRLDPVASPAPLDVVVARLWWALHGVLHVESFHPSPVGSLAAVVVRRAKETLESIPMPAPILEGQPAAEEKP